MDHGGWLCIELKRETNTQFKRKSAAFSISGRYLDTDWSELCRTTYYLRTIGIGKKQVERERTTNLTCTILKGVDVQAHFKQ